VRPRYLQTRADSSSRQASSGFLRLIIPEVGNKFFDCGDLERRFARIRCDHCPHEYLLVFSCKGRCFCPSCRKKKVFGALVTETILFSVPRSVKATCSTRQDQQKRPLTGTRPRSNVLSGHVCARIFHFNQMGQRLTNMTDG